MRASQPNLGVVIPLHRTRRMRARRVKAEDLGLGEIAVAFDHPELGTLTGAAEDVSIHGLSVVARGEPRGLRTGDRLGHVRVTCDAGMLHDGGAIVRRVTERDDAWVIGLELPAGLDLGRMYRSASRRDFASRWQALKQKMGASTVRPAFKAWVADLRAALVSAQALLADEERALASEDRRRRVEAEADYLAVVAPDLLEMLEQAKHDLAHLVGGFSEAEHAEHRAYCALHLGPLLGTSPFLRRAREKPLGYAGDYEMMNMLYRDPAEGDSLFGRALNICFTHEPAAQANKNRIAYIGGLIRKALADHPGRRIRIASLGCGPARELEALLEASPEVGARLDVALIDQEERAISYCERTLGPLAAATGARIHYIREGLRALLTRDSLADKLGARELIYSAGLFDYLEQRMFARITSVLYEALVPDGLLAIGNVAAHNPSRWVMEYFSEWFLIHRSPEQLLGLAAELQPRPAQVTVDAEPSGINLFLLVRR